MDKKRVVLKRKPKVRRVVDREYALAEGELYRVIVKEDGSVVLVSSEGVVPNVAGLRFEAIPGRQAQMYLTPDPGDTRREATEAEKAIETAHMGTQSVRRSVPSSRPSLTGIDETVEEEPYQLTSLHKAALVQHSALRGVKVSKLIPLTDVKQTGAGFEITLSGKDGEEPSPVSVPLEEVEVSDFSLVAKDPNSGWMLNVRDHVTQALHEIASMENILADLEPVLAVSQVDQPAFVLADKVTGQFSVNETLRVWFRKSRMSRDDIEAQLLGQRGDG